MWMLSEHSYFLVTDFCQRCTNGLREENYNTINVIINGLFRCFVSWRIPVVSWRIPFGCYPHVSLRGVHKKVGEKGTLGSFLPLPLPLSLLSLPSLSCFPSSSSPFLCLPSSQVPVRRFRRPSGSMHLGGPFLCHLRIFKHAPSLDHWNW